jgi:hypothetical protein
MLHIRLSYLVHKKGLKSAFLIPYIASTSWLQGVCASSLLTASTSQMHIFVFLNLETCTIPTSRHHLSHLRFKSNRRRSNAKYVSALQHLSMAVSLSRLSGIPLFWLCKHHSFPVAHFSCSRQFCTRQRVRRRHRAFDWSLTRRRWSTEMQVTTSVNHHGCQSRVLQNQFNKKLTCASVILFP